MCFTLLPSFILLIFSPFYTRTKSWSVLLDQSRFKCILLDGLGIYAGFHDTSQEHSLCSLPTHVCTHSQTNKHTHTWWPRGRNSCPGLVWRMSLFFFVFLDTHTDKQTDLSFTSHLRRGNYISEVSMLTRSSMCCQFPFFFLAALFPDQSLRESHTVAQQCNERQLHTRCNTCCTKRMDCSSRYWSCFYWCVSWSFEVKCFYHPG